MPFRHLLFNRRNGAAPQRDLAQQSISLQDAAYFSLEDEFPGYRENTQSWPDHAVPPPSTVYNPMMHRQMDQKMHWQTPNETLDHRNMFPYNSMNAVPYQSSPYDFDSNSLQYSSDMAVDTDVSSISHGSIHSSISSVSHVDVLLDEDLDSVRSLSRKPSVISTASATGESGALCPLITGQVAKCSPDLCGPSAPCLQYANDELLPPIEDCVPGRQSSINVAVVDSNVIDFNSRTPPHLLQQPSRPGALAHCPQDDTSLAKSRTSTSRSRPSVVADSGAAAPSTVDHATSKSTKKVRARQAHSLVERKYRENLNAKIQELHHLLRKVQASRNGSRPVALGPQIVDDDVDDDGTERSTSSRVKKSDVLVEAMSYVHSMEREMKRKDDEIQQLHDRIQMMENWIKTGTIGHTVGM